MTVYCAMVASVLLAVAALALRRARVAQTALLASEETCRQLVQQSRAAAIKSGAIEQQMQYGIVTQTGGNIHLDSTVGVGTTFTIDLPATTEPPPVGEASAAPPRFIDGYATVSARIEFMSGFARDPVREPAGG